MSKKLNDMASQDFQKQDNFSLTDRELVARALKNGNEALAIIVKRYLKLVYSIAKYYVNNSDDADDITQEVFVKIWKNLKKFQPEKKFNSWIYEIAKNTSLDWLKRKNPVPFSSFKNEYGDNYLIETFGGLSSQPHDLLSNAESRSAITKLAPHYQDVVFWHSQQDMTFRQIAELTNQSINTVKSRYRRALVLLRKFISKN